LPATSKRLIFATLCHKAPLYGNESGMASGFLYFFNNYKDLERISINRMNITSLKNNREGNIFKVVYHEIGRGKTAPAMTRKNDIASS
jgi:hypothetical protein